MTQVISEVMLAVSGSLAVSIVAKVTITTALGLAAAWLSRKNRAAVRHAALAATFGAAMLLPIASIVAPPVHVAVPVMGVSRAAVPPIADTIETIPSVTTAADGARVTPATPQASKILLSFLLLAGWIIGTAVFLLPVVTGLWQIRSLRRSGLPWLHGQSIVEALALDAGIDRRVEVLLHEALPGPITCGILHPAIVLPQDAETWKGEDLNRAIVHELEHVRRGDSATRCLARTVCALYWFHPLAWIAWRKLVLEAERSSDDAVLRRSEATAYADQLVGLAKRLPTAQRSPLLAMANRSDLSARVGAVLDGGQRRGRVGKFSLTLACAAALLLVVVMSPLKLVAGPQVTQQPRFEVASVRPDTSGQQRWNMPPLVGGRYSATNASLQMLLVNAYGLPVFQISGGPSWMNSARFDVEAKAPENAPREQIMLMLQSLLADRFKLAVHRETKDAPVFELVVVKGGVKFKEAKCVGEQSFSNPCGGFSVGLRGTLVGREVPVDQFAGNLGSLLSRQVIDKTGLTGKYNFNLTWTPDGSTLRGPGDADAPTPDPGGPSICTALQEQLGLELKSAKAPVQILVIDHVEKPDEN